MNLKQFGTDIKNRKFAPVYLFTGNDEFLIESYLEDLKNRELNPATIDFNFNLYDQKELEPNEVINTLNVFPIMGERRLVVVKSEFLNNLDDQTLKSLEEYLKNPLETTIFILIDEKPDKRRKAYKTLVKYGEVIDFSGLDRAGLTSFINRYLKSNNIQARRQEIDYLIERTHYLDSEEMNTMRLKNYLDSLINFIVQGDLTTEIIDEVIPETVEDNIFKIIDLIVRGKLQGIYPILENFWLQGESPIRIFGLLIYQLRNILKLKIAMVKEKNHGKLAKKTGISQFVIRKTIPVANSYSLERLYELYEEAAKLDLDIKVGNVDPQAGLEYYLLKLYKRK